MRRYLMPLLVCVVSMPALAQEEKKAEKPSVERQLAQLKAVAESVVVVEYTLQYDNGEPPRGSFDGEEFVKQERPMEVFSYLIGPDLVISEELPTHERFVKSVQVRFKDDVVKAVPVAWAVHNHAVYLKLERPLKGSKPLQFNPALEGPYTGLLAGPGQDGATGLYIAEFNPQPALTYELGEFVVMPYEAVIVNKEGVPVGMSMSQYLPPGQTWKRDPKEWEQLTSEKRAELLEKVRAAADSGIVRVTINFRSPKSQGDPFQARLRRGGDDEAEVTEQHLVGVLLDDGRLIVPASLKPNVTARLERIRVYPANGPAVNATFVGSLKDYGAFVAKLEKPAGGVKLSDKPIFAAHNRLVPHANIEVRGEERLIHLGHRRITTYERGWRNQAHPQVADDQADTYLFDNDGALIAFPIARRDKLAEDDRFQGDEMPVTPAHYLLAVLADLEANLDSSNVPLGEEEENRIAWLGLVLQPLGQELARANKVAEQTRDGQTGALVNFVYPGSPAAKAGVEPGWVLVRLNVEGYPQPADVEVDERAAGFAVPWERWDDLPEQMFDRIPQPWPNAQNGLTEKLTEIGFGTKFTAEFYNNGDRVLKEFTVEQSPPHYNSAAKHKDDALGVTVRDITYEVRQYFQLGEEDPGVIVSKVEPGSRASVAGIKPFEMVTHINGQPVKGVREFAAAAKAGGELRLTVKRMTRTRQVPIKLNAPPPAPPAEPEPEPEPAAEGEEE